MMNLILAVVSSAMVSLVMRASEKHIQNTYAMFMANYAVCLMLSRMFMGVLFNGQKDGMGFALILGWINGFLYLGGFVLMKWSMSRNGAMLSSAFMKLGIVVPTRMAIVVFRERPEFAQVLGIVAAVAAVCLIHFEKEPSAGGNKKILLLVLLFVSGIADSLSNVYDKMGNEFLKDHFLFYTFLAAFLLALVMGLAERKKISGKDLWFGLLIGVPNYFSARFLLLALGDLAAVITYPVYSVGTILLVSMVSVLVWKERLSKQKKLALGVVLVALVLLNI